MRAGAIYFSHWQSQRQGRISWNAKLSANQPANLCGQIQRIADYQSARPINRGREQNLVSITVNRQPALFFVFAR